MKQKGKANRIKQVKSGIALSSLSTAGEQDQPNIQQTSKVTSRLFRVVLAGAGFLADAYDLFVVNLVLRLLADCYPERSGDKRNIALVGCAALVGAICGQVS